MIGKLRALWRRRQLEQELEAELAAHLALKQCNLEQSGIPPQQAAREARLALGNATAWRELTRDVWTFPTLESLWRDMAYAVRLLSKEKMFTFIVLLTLTLSVGANTTVFSLINGLLLRNLPVRQPDELVKLVVTHLPPADRTWVNGRETREKERRHVSYPLYEVLRQSDGPFAAVFGIGGSGSLAVQVNGTPLRLEAARVTGSYFRVLGVEAQAGRLLNDSDDVPGGPADGWPAVISDGVWLKLFNRSPQAIGTRIVVERVPFTIAGIAPKAFHGTQPGIDAGLWVPLSAMEAFYPSFHWRNEPSFAMVQPYGRLRPGVTVEQASQQLSGLSPALLAQAKETGLNAEAEKHFLAMKLEARAVPSGDSWLVQSYGPVLWILMAAVAAVLLIAATNLTNLLLARASARRQEIATRLAIGASAGRLRQQLLVESALLALGGVAGGVLFSRWLISALLVSIGDDGTGIPLETPLDWRVILFTALVLCAVILIAGWAPAWLASRVSTHNSLRSAGPGPASMRLRAGLIVVQTALSFALLGGAGLMITSLRTLLQEDTGFQSSETVLITPDLVNAGIDRDKQAPAYRNVLAEVRRLPGIQAAAWTMIPPLAGSLQVYPIEVPGFMHLPPRERSVFSHQVSDGYFAALGLPLRAGRDFPSIDSARRNICIVSENVARKYFGSAAVAIGQSITPGGDRTAVEIIGVAADSKYNHVREAQPPTVYMPYWSQQIRPGMTLAVRHTGPAAPALAAVQGVLQKEAGRLPYITTSSIAGNLRESVRTEQVLTWLLGGFAAFALLISATGIAGLLSYLVAQRRREIGIRVALGAVPSSIGYQFQRRGMTLALLGLAAGGALAYSLRHTIDTYLFRTAPTDPWVWGAVAAALLASAYAATALPARRAARIDPMEALRVE